MEGLKTLLEKLKTKKQKLDKYKPLPAELIKNLSQWFNVELTYTSNAIEGNTLNRTETAVVVEKGLTIGGKTVKEHLEALNHGIALSFVEKKLISKKREQLTVDDILSIHSLILRTIDDEHAGIYRTVAVRIAGSPVVLPNPMKVPELMSNFMNWLHNSTGNPVIISADAHLKFVGIHPFVDGNGRTARLLMNLLLMQEGYPPVIIHPEERVRYIDALEKAHLKNDPDDFYKLIVEVVDRSLDIYLEAVEKSNLKTK